MIPCILPWMAHARAGSGRNISIGEKTLFELVYELEEAQPLAGKRAPNSAKA